MPKKNKIRRAKKRLERDQKVFDSLPRDEQMAYNRPGSQKRTGTLKIRSKTK